MWRPVCGHLGIALHVVALAAISKRTNDLCVILNILASMSTDDGGVGNGDQFIRNDVPFATHAQQSLWYRGANRKMRALPGFNVLRASSTHYAPVRQHAGDTLSACDMPHQCSKISAPNLTTVAHDTSVIMKGCWIGNVEGRCRGGALSVTGYIQDIQYSWSWRRR